MSMWSFPRFKRDATFFEWQARAREPGGALTNHRDHRGRTLKLVSGPVSRLGALFGASYWYGDGLEKMLGALDRDAGLAIDFVECEGLGFELALDRVPKRRRQHAAALGKVFGVKPAAIEAALDARLWTHYNELY